MDRKFRVSFVTDTPALRSFIRRPLRALSVPVTIVYRLPWSGNSEENQECKAIHNLGTMVLISEYRPAHYSRSFLASHPRDKIRISFSELR